MSKEKKCLTPDAMFKTRITNDGVMVGVIFPHAIIISEDQAKIIENKLHDAVEQVLAPLFDDSKPSVKSDPIKENE